MMTRQVWERDFTKVAGALRPYVKQTTDGAYIDPDAPSVLLGWYGDLLSVGYYHGWLR